MSERQLERVEREQDLRAIADSIAHDSEQIAELERATSELTLSDVERRSVVQQVEALTAKIRRETEIERHLADDGDAEQRRLN